MSRKIPYILHIIRVPCKYNFYLRWRHYFVPDYGIITFPVPLHYST